MVWRRRPAPLLGCVLVLACTLGARADDDGPEEAPLLARIVSAAQTGDAPQLAALGQEAIDSQDVDPWILADALGAGGYLEAARAFAKALPVESEALLAYLATEAAQEGHEDVRAALDALFEDIDDRRWHKASLQLDGIEMPADLPHVLATRTVWVRALVLEQTGRTGDVAQLAFGAARLAESLGYLRGFGAISLYKRCLECAVPQGAHDLALEALQRLYVLQAEHEGLASLYGTTVDQASVELLRGQAPHALSRLMESDRLAERLGSPLLRAIAHSMMQEAYELQGLYPQALRARAAADAWFDTLPQADAAALELVERAGFHPTRERWDHVVRCALLDMSLGQSQAAEDRLRAAVEAAQAASDAIGLGVALGNRAGLHARLGRWDEAAADLAAAERAFESMEGEDPDVPRQLAGVLNTEAEVALQRTRFELREARRTGMLPAELEQLERHLRSTQLRPGLARARAGLAAMSRHGAWGGLANLRETIGSVFGALGQPEQALAVLKEARRDAAQHRLRSDEALVLVSMARVQLEAGRHAEALRTARDALERIRDLAGGLPDHFRARAQLGVMDVYDIGALAAGRLAAGGVGGESRAEALFELLEAARGGSLAQALGGQAATLHAALPAELKERAQRAERAAIEAQIARLVHLEGPGERDAAWRETKLQLEQAYGRAALAQAEALGEVQRHLAEDPRLAGLRPLPADPQRLAAVPGEAFVILGLLGDEAWAVVCGQGRVREVRLAGTPAEVARIEADAQQLTTLAAPRGEPDLESPDSLAALARLRATLVEPLGLPDGIERLVLCPDGNLAYLPWSLLVEGAAAPAIALVPSAATLDWQRSSLRRASKGVLGIGACDFRHVPEGEPLQPLFDAVAQRSALVERTLPQRWPRFRPLPSSRDEILAVTKEAGDVALLGADATEERLARELAARGAGAPWRVLQVATHGYVDREQPSLAFLALTPSAGSDGLLTVQEVLGRPCHAEVVILSACHVGRGEIVRGEGIMGLARAFLVAGARQVVVASWAVDDAHATRLMTALHEHLKVEPDAAKALAQARLTSPSADQRRTEAAFAVWGWGGAGGR